MSIKTLKNGPQKLLIIGQDPFISQSSPEHSPQPTAQNWFFILWNLRTRHLFSYLWSRLVIKDRCLLIFCLRQQPMICKQEINRSYFSSNKASLKIAFKFSPFFVGLVWSSRWMWSTYYPDMGFDVPRAHLNEWITTTKWGSPLWLAVKG